MTDALQGLHPERLMGLLWTVLAGWLVWPVLCGVLGAGREQTLKGVMHGLFWGPIGIVIILMSKQKHTCPTCGQKTLDHPMLVPPGMAGSPPSAERPEVVHGISGEPPMAHPASAIPRFGGKSVAAAMGVRPISDGAASPSLQSPSGAVATPGRSVLEEACSGYSEEEAARLLAWVNRERDRMHRQAPVPAATSPLAASGPAPTVSLG